MLDAAEKKFNSIAKEGQKTVLLPQEKEIIKSSMIRFLKEHPETIDSKHLPAKASTQRQPYFFFADLINSFYAKPALQYVSLVMTVIILSGTGVALAAQHALPGDLLYPVKTQLDEKVIALTLFSDQAKAEYDINLAQLRLEEAETVAAQNKLNDQSGQEVATLLSAHLGDIQNRILSLESKEDTRLALEIKLNLDTIIKTHQKIIDTLGISP